MLFSRILHVQFILPSPLNRPLQVQFVGVDKMYHKEHCVISLLVLCRVGQKRS